MKAPPALLALAVLVCSCSPSAPAVAAVPVQRDAIERVVTASGTLAAQDTVLVGSQVSGTIQTLYVDYNSRVHRGQVLARLDPSSFQAALDQAKANLAQIAAQGSAAASSAASYQLLSSAARETARSEKERIEAADDAVRKTKSVLSLAILTAHRDRELLRQGYVAQNVYDADVVNIATAHAAYVAAQTEAVSVRHASSAGEYQAGSSVAQAAGAAASQQAGEANVQAARAAVRQAEINLEHATITSPVDGTVIERNVSVGQTVAAALAAPTLFTIAKDLTKMQLNIALGEPDVGSVRAGDEARFTVLAYPGRVFVTRLEQVRQNPTIVNNVTTYNSVAYPSNRDGALRPGMTANVQITVATFPDALIVPLAAMQWRPSVAIAKRYDVVVEGHGGEGSAAARSSWGATGGASEFAVSAGRPGRLYVLDGRVLRGVSVDVLAVDGMRVGVASLVGELGENDRVVVDDSTEQKAGTP